MDVNCTIELQKKILDCITLVQYIILYNIVGMKPKNQSKHHCSLSAAALQIMGVGTTPLIKSSLAH